MTTKQQALYRFWSSFGVTAFEENAVPTDPEKRADFFENVGTEYPYITYEMAVDFYNNPLFLSASLWYHDTSWAAANEKANEIGIQIGTTGILMPYTGGALWITRGSPFAQAMGDPSDDLIKRIVINVAMEYISDN